jgi:hypothetical protein
MLDVNISRHLVINKSDYFRCDRGDILYLRENKIASSSDIGWLIVYSDYCRITIDSHSQ